MSADVLLDVRDYTAALVRCWVERRLDQMRWLPHQARLLRDDSTLRLLRTGNQLGKTEVGVAEVLYAAAGVHPYRPPTSHAGEYWICCASWGQSLAIQAKVHALVWDDRLRPDTMFSAERGYGGRYPSVSVRHEDGNYSIIRFKTTGQETLDLAGATIDGALFDEPPRAISTFSEVQKRVQASGGWILLTLTPIGADVTWLQELVAKGMISEHHARLEPEALIPEGCTEPLRVADKRGRLHRWDAAWIERVIALTPEHEVDIRVHGMWDSRPVDAYFGAVWNESAYVLTHTQLQDRYDERGATEITAHVGIDHGHRPGKQYACLIEIDDSDPEKPFVAIVDEYTDELGLADPERDANGILSMLGAAGWEWSELSFVGGDRDHMPGTEQRKSNRDLEYVLAGKLGLTAPSRMQPRIRTVKRGSGRGKGSVVIGLRFLYRAMADRRFVVLEHCQRARSALRRYRLRTMDDEHKDVLDAVRYALDPYIFYKRSTGAATSVRFG